MILLVLCIIGVTHVRITLHLRWEICFPYWFIFKLSRYPHNLNMNFGPKFVFLTLCWIFYKFYPLSRVSSHKTSKKLWQAAPVQWQNCIKCHEVWLNKVQQPPFLMKYLAVKYFAISGQFEYFLPITVLFIFIHIIASFYM